MVGRTYNEDYYTLIDTKYKSSGPYSSIEDFIIFYHLSIWELKISGVAPLFIFQWPKWQDLCRAPHNTTTDKTHKHLVVDSGRIFFF